MPRELTAQAPLDRLVLGGHDGELAILAVGRPWLDVVEWLRSAGIDEAQAQRAGLGVYAVAHAWPLADGGVVEAARRRRHVLVIEEKGSLVEDQLARALYASHTRPTIHGKTDQRGQELIPATGALGVSRLSEPLGRWLRLVAPDLVASMPHGSLRTPISVTLSPASTATATSLVRAPTFCAGCPHSTSTVVPDGSIALAGIGCHGMATRFADRNTAGMVHMGGEGANWVGASLFTDREHVFQNLGDGTFFHSGMLAIRAAVAAGTPITYKILANGAVAMTGGQTIEGESIDHRVEVPHIVRLLLAEGVGRVAVVHDGTRRYKRGSIPRSVKIHPRRELDAVQREMRAIRGVTAIVYDQTCAAELRRLRKRKQLPQPTERVFINERVCEGCGDCNVQSTCVAVEAVETEFGRKRRIDQHICNVDLSCLRGYCPSFVTVREARSETGRQPDGAVSRTQPSAHDELPEPTVEPGDADVVVAGIGGTGIVTVGAVLGVAAHLAGMYASVLDITGLAQKNGPVTSHVRLRAARTACTQRIPPGQADVVLAADVVVAASPDVQSLTRRSRTTVVANHTVVPTAQLATDPDLDLRPDPLVAAVAARASAVEVIDATGAASGVVGNAATANTVLVGYAYQRGLLPIPPDAIRRAITLNGAAVVANLAAFEVGRSLAVTDASEAGDAPTVEHDVATTIERRAADLTAYQNRRYAARYRTLVDKVRALDDRLRRSELSAAVAHNYWKVLAYKDEYEVARLYTDGTFRESLDAAFEDPSFRVHLAPQIGLRHGADGRVRKIAFPAWLIMPALRLMARAKVLRGTPLDLFGRTAHRRRERRMITEYEESVQQILASVTPASYDVAVVLARLPEAVRGFGVVKDVAMDAADHTRGELLARLTEEANTQVADAQMEGASRDR